MPLHLLLLRSTRRSGLRLRPPFFRYVLASLLTLWGALLAPPVPADSLTFDQALALAPQSPGAQAPRRALDAREAGDREIGGTAQALTLTLNPGYRWTPTEEQGLEGQVGLAQTWNLANLGKARRRAAAAERAVLASQARAAALASRLEAARLWIELNTLEHLEVLARQQLELARQTERLMARAAEAGVRTSMDAAEARAFRAEVARAAADVQGKTHHAAIDLRTAIGQSPGPSLRTAGPLPRPVLPDDNQLIEYVRQAQELPAPAAHRLLATAARTRQLEESAAVGPLLSVGAQLQREPPTAYTAMGTLSLALSPFDRGMRARSLATGQAELLEGESGQARLSAQAEVTSAFHELRHTRERRDLIESDWLVAADELANRRERAFNVGETTLYQLLDARRRRIEVESLLVRARGDATWAAVRLWLLIAQIEQALAAP